MFQSKSFALFILLSFISVISAEWCYSGYSTYYCYSGQTCGTYYGDCRGLPTYAIIGIVSACIVILSICIRCCIHFNTVNNRRVPRAVPVFTPTPGQPVYQVHSFSHNFATGRPAAVPVHSMREDAPPTYTAVVSETTPQGKY
ncbi:unnamed protein product [Adineta ricciae]|uniref:Uncharacterized protein n=1 Tax=Adineta ricciae TaxID=249248 RepID=A0A814MS32_ADIRI|nr:unnamed protein product [Adineta ricciae]CAF1103372.1 unnamed protein product [Adineta ricciae]